jgi:NADH-quinone oxidoreductase subunit E
MNIEEILSRYERNKEHILAVLHDIQLHDPNNHVSGEAMRRVAEWLRVPLSSVYGVLRYYSMYSTTPRGRHLIRVCNSVVCQMQGGDVLLEVVQDAVDHLGKGPDGEPLFSVELTECLGYCEGAPALMIDEETIGPVSPDDAAHYLNKLVNR